MIDQGVFDAIESQDLSIRLGVVSGTRPFVSAAWESAEAGRLRAAMRSEPKAYGYIVSRTARLSSLMTDERYENPNDTALAIYLLALRACAPRDVYVAAAEMVAGASGLFWAPRVTSYLDAVDSAGGSDLKTEGPLFASTSDSDVDDAHLRVRVGRSASLWPLAEAIATSTSGCVNSELDLRSGLTPRGVRFSTQQYASAA